MPSLPGLTPIDSWHIAPPRPPSLSRSALRRHGTTDPNSLPLTSARATRSPQYRQAIVATIWSFVVTIMFAVFIVYPMKGERATMDFFTGFLVEKSLSVDNLFVFLMLFQYFRVPERHTQRVLTWGIVSALVLRGGMIAVGVAAVLRFRWVLLIFAFILILSAYKMLGEDDDETELSENYVMRIARYLVDASDEYDGDKFFTRVGGKRRATPMLVVLICIELSDVIFAVDSIPAVLGITQDPFIVYTSNAFALLALRSLYLLLSRSLQQLHYLRHAVALILGFVGMKMILDFVHIEISSSLSLAVILSLLAGGTIASIIRNNSRKANGPGSQDDHLLDEKLSHSA
jgi:tellurite resistance protein TerC